ncbi:hypothetical protein QRX41_07050 [Bifidobacterium sp. H1HS16N]|uniref:Secreted protein n=1 Tax=Bifidobacterium kimbladii TaxID=1293826 RepID=A0ABU3KHT6_9BIFI|nr:MULTISPECIES: hypothetical protein [unclassified Bifidobacterium]MDT7509880.1 hypothetical protein [Bifidobacterium sp. H1HS16N]MDT7512767.1 hypothetical protein [Bifidobacterium sp. H1HS10N]
MLLRSFATGAAAAAGLGVVFEEPLVRLAFWCPALEEGEKLGGVWLRLCLASVPGDLGSAAGR